MKSTRTGFSLAAFAAAILLLFSSTPSVFAQDRDYDQDPPARAGRIGYVQGSVSFQPGGQGDWVDAVANRPLTSGDNLWADRNSRAEVQIGSTSVRLGSETSVTLLDLTNNVTQVRLSMGSLYFRVRHLDRDDTFEIDTPNLAFTVDQPGQYRVDVNGNGDQTTATVWRGDAEITGGGNSYRLNEGQQGTFSGTDQLRYDVGEIGSNDDFDRWCLSRDERADRARSSHYVSAEMTGYEDLDDYGRWHYVDGYGDVWTPVGVPYGWAPYRYGHWVYVSPWGWTWVEEEPWGFAPFHYGRWAFVGGGWCWVPGPVAVVPVYSPALVAFVGGGGFSVGIGVGGGVGWFPLAPGEVFVPWYRTSPRYVQNVNVTNTHVTVVQVTNVYNNVTVNHVNNVTYVNQRVTSGVTVVNRDTFVNARPVNDHIVRVDSREIMRAPVTHEVVQNIQPARQSVIGAGRPVRIAPPPGVTSRAVVATREPVAFNRPVATPGNSRAVTPPPVRTVRPAPVTEAQPLERGARGTTLGTSNAPANAGRPMPPSNRGEAPSYSSRPAAPENNPAARPVPRPGMPQNTAPQNVPMTSRGEAAPRPAPDYNPGNARPNRPENNRPNAPEYSRPVPQESNRPNAPENNRSSAPENNRSSAPENNRPADRVPRPPSSRPEQPQVQQEQPRSNAPYARQEPTRPETPRTAQEQPVRPNNPEPQDNRRVNVPQESRPQPTARQPETRNEPPARPQARPEPAPQMRPAPARQPEMRPQPAPRPEMRPQPAPAPVARPSEPPQRESRPQESRGEKGNSQNKGGTDQKDQPRFH